MSIINVFLSPSKALIGIDTEGIDHTTGDFFPVSKMVHLPHANVVMAGRGIRSFMLALFNLASQFKDNGDIDALDNLMPNAFDLTYNAVRMNPPSGLDVSLFDSQEIVLVGWSSTLNRMRAICYAKAGPKADLMVTEIQEPGYMMPWNNTWGEPPEGDDRHAMARLALAQTKNAKLESPTTAMGGRLLLAELTRHSLFFSSHCDLPASESRHRAPVVFSREESKRIEAGDIDAELAEKISTLQAPCVLSTVGAP